MPQAAVPIAAEAAVASTLTAAEIAAAQAAAAELAAAQAAAAQTVAATNASVLSAIAPTAAPAAATTAGVGAGTGAGAGVGTGGISNLVNTTGGPTTFEQVFSQGQEIAKGSTELGKLASTASELPMGPPDPYAPTLSPGFQPRPEPLSEINLARELPPITQPLEAAQTSAFNTTPTLTQYGAGAPPIEPPVIEAAFTHPNPEQVERLRLLGEADAGPLETLLPQSPPPPPIEPLPINETFNGYPQSIDPAGGFDTPGFDSADYARAQGYRSGVVPSTIVTSPSGGTPLTGIDMLAKEVGSTSAFNTAPTLTQYGAGAPSASSVLPPTTGGPAPGIDKLVQTNLSGMGSNMPPAPPFANQTMIPNTPVSVTGSPSVSRVESLAQGLDPASQDIGKTLLENVNNEAIKQVPPSIGSGNYPYSPMSEQDKVMSEIYDRIAPQTTVSGETVYPQTIGTGAPAPEAGGIKELFNQGLDYAKKNPLTTAMFANTAYNYLNPVKPYEKEKYKPTFKPGLYTGYQPVQPTPYTPQYAHGGLADLGGYSDGGRMLKGPGDGMSDDIPATIANKQPARLANEEFVIPADVVSHLGNGSSEAGAKVLYKMMDRVRRARTGSKKQGKQINPEKYLA